MFRCLGLAFCLFLTFIVIPFSCVAEASPGAERKGWEASALFGFDMTRGNSETLLLSAGAKAEKVSGKDQWLFDSSFKYGESEDEKTEEESKLEMQYRRLLSERWFLPLGIELTHDDIADVDYRVEINPGLGYYLVKTEAARFSLESGPAYVIERLAGEDIAFVGVRAVERFDYKLSETSKLFQSLKVVVSTETAEDSFFELKAGIEAAVFDTVSLVLSVEDRYDNVPAPDTERNDFSLTTSLKFLLL